MKIGIIGSGWIADKMAITITNLQKSETVKALQTAMGVKPTGETIEKYAIAARSQQRAQQFADEHGFQKAYGSYEELVNDPEVELVYIATPHSHHKEHALLAINAGKHVLVEKAFTANTSEAQTVLDAAKARGVFCMEAVWTRCMPLSHKVSELLKAGAIGNPEVLYASLCYDNEEKERIQRPELCGGTLLDLGVYSINFARMYFGKGHASMHSACLKGETGVDLSGTITLLWNDGRMANLQSSVRAWCNRMGMIAGRKGYIEVQNINCPEKVTLYHDYKPIETFLPPKEQSTGYEYEVLASLDAIRSGQLESPFMPHAETIAIMQMMDSLRQEWGVVYPAD